MSDFTFRDLEVVAVTICFRDGVAWLWRLYQRRYIEPKKAHRQVLVEQTDWYKERADKLAAFRWQLGQGPKPDEFKLTELVSKLDEHDRRWAMKETDVEILRRSAAEKGSECRDNAAECGRLVDEIARKIFW